MSDDAFNWIDEELRSVPLPEGLLARLRRLGRSSVEELTDSEMDQALADVIVPQNLLLELAAIPEDELLDERLQTVDVPEHLLAEIACIPVDEQLRDIPVPVDLLLELRRIPPRRRRRRMPTAQLALAASLLLMITLGYVMSIAGLVITAYDQLPEEYAEFTIDRPRVELVADVEVDEALTIAVADEPPDAIDESEALAHDPTRPPIDTHTIAEVLQSEFPSGYGMFDSLAPLRYGILGQPSTSADQTPDLEMLSGLATRGVEPPIAVGFDRQFLIRERTTPIVSLLPIKRIADQSRREALLNALRERELPLWTDTESFDAVRRQSATGRLPAARDVHVEDFLAAMDFQYAEAPAGRLAIRAAAGPSVFGEDGAEIMQVGVQAGGLKKYGQPASHITLAVDVSDSMQWDGRLESVRDALSQFVRLLRTDDHVSLVVFNEQAFTVLEDIPGDQHELLSVALDRLSAHGGTNVVAGLQAAIAMTESRAAIQSARRHLVIISDGMPTLPEQFSRHVEDLVRQVQAEDVALHVVSVSDSPELNEGLGDLADMVKRDVARCTTAGALHGYFCDQILGASPVVAQNATLTVSFNPRAIQGYRLLGHETTSAGGTLPADVKSTLLARQAATAMYEVWLEPDAPSLVATAVVEWTDPSGRSQSVRQEIHRSQFKQSWREAALPLQAAVIAAEAAEVLRQSPFAEVRNRDLRDVLAMAEEVNPLLAKRTSFQRFVQVLQQAEAARRGVRLVD